MRYRKWRMGLSIANLPILEVNNICLLSGGYLDIKEQEIVLVEVEVIEDDRARDFTTKIEER